MQCPVNIDTQCYLFLIMFLFHLYIYITFSVLNVFVNYIQFNYYLCLHIHNFSTILTCNTLYLWFLLFMFLIIINLSFYATKNVYDNNNFFVISFLYIILYYIICFLFLSDDCIIFIITFESMLFTIMATSMYFIFNNRFIIALFYLIIFSILSGVCCFLLLTILLININLSGYLLFTNNLLLNNFSNILLIWALIYVIFGINFPIYPFYFWLLAVHVEVSSELSALLAGIILNSGFIGVFNFLLVFLLHSTTLLANFSSIFVIIGLFACNINLLIITDYNNIIGSWSILHVNIALLFVWYNNSLLITLFILANLGHILSSSSFFFCLGFTYENFNNNHIFMISSTFSYNIYSFIFIFLILNNIDFPFFLLFYVELLNFYAILFVSNYLLLLLILVVLTLFVSSLLLYFTVNYYQNNWNNNYIRLDLNISELSIFIILVLYSIIIYWWLTLF